MDSTSQTQRVQEMQARLPPQFEEARQSLSDLNSRIVHFIRERPGVCLLGALAFGFIVGKIASRR